MQPHSSRALPRLGTDSSGMVLEVSYGSGLCPHQQLHSQALAAGPGSRLGLSGNPERLTAFGLRATDDQVGFGSEKGEDKFLDSGALELCSFLFVGESWDPRVLIEAGGSTLKRWARPRAEAHLTSCRGWHCGEGPQLISQARRETKSKVSERSATWRVQTHRSRMGTEKKTKGKVVRVEREGQAEELSLGKANVLCP